MSDLKGMDITAARQLAGRIVTVGEDVGAKLVGLASELPNLQWLGADGDKFRTDCAQHLKQLMTQVQQAAEDWSKHVNSQADQQEQASA